MIIKEDNPHNFTQDLFENLQKIRKEFRNLENPKTIYGRLSILLHSLAGLIVDVDDKHNDITDLYFVLLNIATECQYGCEQWRLCQPKLQIEQEKNIYKEKCELQQEILEKIRNLQFSYNPFEVQKGAPPKRLYEIDENIFREIEEIE